MGSEVELVPRTREAPQAHALEEVMGLQVRKADNLLGQTEDCRSAQQLRHCAT